MVKTIVDATVDTVDSATSDTRILGIFWTRNWSILTLFDLAFVPNIPNYVRGREDFCGYLFSLEEIFSEEKNLFCIFLRVFLYLSFQFAIFESFEIWENAQNSSIVDLIWLVNVGHTLNYVMPCCSLVWFSK